MGGWRFGRTVGARRSGPERGLAGRVARLKGTGRAWPAGQAVAGPQQSQQHGEDGRELPPRWEIKIRHQTQKLIAPIVRWLLSELDQGLALQVAVERWVRRMEWTGPRTTHIDEDLARYEGDNLHGEEKKLEERFQRDLQRYLFDQGRRLRRPRSRAPRSSRSGRLLAPHRGGGRGRAEGVPRR